MQGCLLRVHIDERLDDQDVDLVGELTSIQPVSSIRSLYGAEAAKLLGKRLYGAGLWRGVCLPSNRSRLTGWASIEHPDMQRDEAVKSAGPVYAFVMEMSSQRGGLVRHDSSPMVSRKFCTVLFLRHAESEVPGFDEPYERIGMGALFGNEVLREYESSATTTISLI